MKQSILSRNTVLLLAAGFFYFASPMMVTPLITGFCEELGAGAALMGMAGGVLYGSLDIRLFYPALLLTVPAVIAVYALNRRVLK